MIVVMKNKIKNSEFQNIWNSEWRSFAKILHLKINERVVKEILFTLNQNIKGKKILEVGAGSGSDVIALAKKGAVCVALDFSKESIDICNKLAKQEKVNVQTILADCRRIPAESDYFDLVFSVGLVEHFKDPIPVLREQLRVLKKGGFLIIDVPQKYNFYTIMKRLRMLLGSFPFGWETEYSVNGLKRISRGLDVKIVRFYGRNSAFLDRLPDGINFYRKKIFPKIEESHFAPFVCLNIGVIYQK